MSAITTHVLDTARGRPAEGLAVLLEGRAPSGAWESIGSGPTDADGRQRSLMSAGAELRPGRYRLTFETHAYFAGIGVPAFYPRVVIEFETAAGERHYHVPLLLAPFGYSTYRGS